MKAYDRAYFRRWYGDRTTRIASAETTARKVHLAVSAAEMLLGRRIRSVLDVGCGEGRWHGPLRRLRPGIAYEGVDGSEWVVKRYGTSRHIRLGTFGGLRTVPLRRRVYDLVVCADVVQYIGDDDLRRGLAEIRRRTGGVAYIETFAAEDSMEGDRDGWIERPARTLRRFFRDAGLTHCGLYCWIDERKIRNANAFEVSAGLD